MIDDGTLLAARPGQLPLDRRRRLFGRVAARDGAEARPEGAGALLHRPDAQHRRPGPEQPRHPQGGHLDAAAPAGAGGGRVVPLHHRPHRRRQRHAGRGLAHRLHRRARLRGVVPSARCRDGVRRGLGSRPAAWAQADGPAGARHAAHRGRADLRRLRVLRPDRPVRGRHRLHRAAQDQDRRLHRPRGADPAQGAARSASWSASTSTATSPSATATASISAAPRSARSPPPCARRS